MGNEPSAKIENHQIDLNNTSLDNITSIIDEEYLTIKRKISNLDSFQNLSGVTTCSEECDEIDQEISTRSRSSSQDTEHEKVKHIKIDNNLKKKTTKINNNDLFANVPTNIILHEKNQAISFVREFIIKKYKIQFAVESPSGFAEFQKVLKIFNEDIKEEKANSIFQKLYQSECNKKSKPTGEMISCKQMMKQITNIVTSMQQQQVTDNNLILKEEINTDDVEWYISNEDPNLLISNVKKVKFNLQNTYQEIYY